MVGRPVKRNFDRYVARTDTAPLVLESLAAIVLGILLLLQPQNATQLIITLVGLFCLIRGLAWLFSLLGNRKEWGWRLFGGILGVVVGALLLARPLGSAYLGSAAIIWLVAAAGAAYGFVMIVKGFGFGDWGSVVLGFLALILSFLLVIRAPTASLWVPLLIGLLAVAAGVAGIVAAFRKRAGKQ